MLLFTKLSRIWKKEFRNVQIEVMNIYANALTPESRHGVGQDTYPLRYGHLLIG